MEYKDYLYQLKILLSKDFNCTPSDFDKDENVLTISALNEERRMYSGEKEFFCMVTLGKNAVITADECLFPFLSEYIKDKKGYWIFEQPHTIIIEKELNKYGYTIDHSHHLFLPEKDVQPKNNYAVKFFNGYDEIKSFYGDKRFPNALCESYDLNRPDTIAVCAYDSDNNIMGMAGCSEDAPHWAQIGIDVLPAYRSKGVGTYLVTLLKNEIIKKGDIPFYGTGIANFHSCNIAINTGFKPTWIEIRAKKISNNS